MVKSLQFWIVYLGAIILSMILFTIVPQLTAHPLAILYFLFLVGAPEIYFLAHYSIPYFHWFFYVKKSVVQEIRTTLLVYLLFLIIAVIVNSVLASSVFIVLTALVFPLVAGSVAFVHELIEYEKRHGFLKK